MYTFLIYLGATSKYYDIYDSNKKILHVTFEHDFHDLTANINELKTITTESEYKNSCQFVLSKLELNNIDIQDIKIIGIRISLPGTFFTKTKIIDGEYIKQIRDLSGYIPNINTELILYEIHELQKLLPEIPIIAISDTEFHNKLPNIAKAYPIPDNKIYKFGSHGILLKSVLTKINSITIQKDFYKNIIICNLDDNCSVTAIKDGQSIETSTGFTEFDGLLGITTSGNIDNSAIAFIAQKKHFSWSQINNYLTRESGLISLSHESADLKLLLYLQKEKNKNASDALEYLAYNIKKYIGSYIAILEKLDLLVFAGKFGYSYPSLRQMVCDGLDTFGIHLDKEDNNDPDLFDGFIQNQCSKVKILTIKSDASEEMILEINKFLH